MAITPKLLFALIAAVAAVVLFLFDKAELAVAAVAVIWGIYERFSKNEVEKKFFNSDPQGFASYKYKK